MDKIIKGWLLVNYKTGNVEFRKRKVTKEPYYKICIGFNLTVHIPDKEEITINKEVTMPDIKIKEMFLNNL